MKVIIFARPEFLDRLSEGFQACGAEIIAGVADPLRILDCVRNSPADLLVLDSDLGLHAALGSAREGRELHGAQVAFLSPTDDLVGDVLLGLDPVTLLPASFDQDDIAALLSKARARDDAASAARRSRTSERSARSRLELVALASTPLAVIVGYFLPDGLTIFEGAGHKAYYIVIGLGVISLVCLLSIRRPVLAGLHAGLIALATILPTQ